MRKVFGAKTLLLVVALLLFSCATPQLDRLKQDSDSLPNQHVIENVPNYTQQESFCGPNSLAMTLSWSTGKTIDPKTLISTTYTPKKNGALKIDLISSARRNGQVVLNVRNLTQLIKEASLGRPAIVLRNQGISLFPQWHYSVVVGYNLKNNEILLNSGSETPEAIALDRFERTWSRGDYWGIFVTPADNIPENVENSEVMPALSQLEILGFRSEAKKGYEILIKRDRRFAPAYFALSNIVFLEGDKKRAADLLFTASTLEPKNPWILNNLAHIYWDMGERLMALRVARKAIEIATDKDRKKVEESLALITKGSNT